MLRIAATLCLLLLPAMAMARVVTYATHSSFDAPGLSKSEEDAELTTYFEGIAEQNCGIDLVRVPWGQHRVSIYSADLIYQRNGKWYVDLGRSDAGTYSIWLHNGTRNGGRKDYYVVHPSGQSARGLMGTVALHEFGHFLPEFRPAQQGGSFDYYGHINHDACIMDIDAASRSMCPQEAAIFRKHYGPPRKPPADLAGTWRVPAANANFVYGDGTYVALLGIFDGTNWGACLYHPPTSTFHIRHSLSAGVAQVSFSFGPENNGFQPICGDWDFDGRWGVGLYDPATSRFLLKNELTPGRADRDFVYGSPGGQALSGLLGTYARQP